MGRAVVMFLGASILSWWLVGTIKKASVNAFKRGSDFLAAGRLEPAFAEFRRCEANEPLASAMYKLSLAFEEQAMPERAEAGNSVDEANSGLDPGPEQILSRWQGRYAKAPGQVRHRTTHWPRCHGCRLPGAGSAHKSCGCTESYSHREGIRG